MLHLSSRNTLFGGMLVALLGLSSAATAQTITPIGTLRPTDPSTGIPVANGSSVTVRGTIYGIDLRLPANNQPGFQLTIMDNTGGFGLFSALDVNGVSTLNEGDSVQVTGTVNQFNGLGQLSLSTGSGANTTLVPGANITSLGRARRLATPRVIAAGAALSEADESQLVRIAGPVTSVTPSQWLTNSTSSGYNVDVVDSRGTQYQLRINRGTGLYNQPAPSGPFSVTGIGGQFDNALPYDEGYQLLPRRASDITVVTSNKEAAFGRMLELYPNPAANVLRVAGLNGQKNVSYEVVSQLGQRVLSGKLEGSTIVTEQLSAGVYVLRITTAEGTASRRFAKQ